MSKFRNMLVNNKGFTLIELLVVIAVLGILAAIAIPRLSGVTDKARLSEAVSALGTLKNAQAMYATENNEYTTTKSDLWDYIDENSMPSNWTLTINTGSTGDTDSYDMKMVYDDNNDLVARIKSGWDGVGTTQDGSTVTSP